MTFIPCNWLDGKHTVFGKVIDGWDVLDALESVGSQTGATRAKCVIADCGQLWTKIFILNFFFKFSKIINVLWFKFSIIYHL